jgi:CRISPR-associated protein (TIGR03985 family)
MSDPIWNEPPTVPLLQWFARGSLKQNLDKAIRLWVWMRLLYGDRTHRLSLPDPFTYADVRDVFFSRSHPKGEKPLPLHDVDCPCAKPMIAWLFGVGTVTLPQWREALSDQSCQQVIQLKSQEFQQALQQHDALPKQFQQILQKPLFGKTRRTLAEDLQTLVDIHCLKREEQSFRRVSELPPCPQAFSANSGESYLSVQNLEFFTQPDLAAIAENFFQPINDYRRFFVHVEYVIPTQHLDRVDEWQAQLRDLWHKTPIPPLLMQYQPAGQSQVCSLVVYPVCIYYYRRGPYLCAYGQVPNATSEQKQMNWRNYRLDRIQSFTPLQWTAPQVPIALRQQYQSRTLPTPDMIEEWMGEAWGFDYYEPAQLLLLRFDREWDDRYIQGTLRHPTFKAVSYQEAKRLIQQTLKGQDKETMLKRLQACSPKDAYYQAFYRRDDPNVRQRLRAWRPRVEILLPWDLRERMATEVRREWEFYDG